MNRKQMVLVGMAVLAATTVANAGFIDFGGWRASWDASLDGLVDITVTSVSGNTATIEKTAEFTEGPGPTGVFPTIPITFRQISANAVTRIAIDAESLTNSTGVDWNDFEWELLDSGDAVFETPIAFSTSPLNTQTLNVSKTKFTASGGTVPNFTSFFPGDGATNGVLVMDVKVKATSPFTVFTLTETPSPEPATLLCLGMAGIWLARRRR